MTRLRFWLMLSKSHPKACSSLLTAIAVLAACAQNSYANPEGGVVTAGQAQINNSVPNTVQVIQSTDKAVVNWNSFNVGQHERVEFQQPGSQSITLNRINPSNGVSQIYGSITANGQVWLMNPAGIWFAPGSHVNVAGLLATTAGISDADFMAGKYHFLQSPDWNGAVINEGMIVVLNNGLAALVAPGAVNKGQIIATLGTAVLASSNEFTIDFAGDSLVTFAVGNDVKEFAKDQNGESLTHAVENSGSISANGGKIQIAATVASKVLDKAINMNGIAVADSVNVKNGEIIFSAGGGRVTVSGTVTASGKKSGEKGGVIKILGDEVALVGHAVVDASGDAGGGTILIGGNARGTGTEQNASYTYIGANVNIHADAKTHGDGGKIVVWSNLGTKFYGNIYARGGAESGNGGWVETSGKEYLQAVGNVTASAANGKKGDWLLDPRDVTITTTTTNGAFDGGSPNIYTPTGDTATVNATAIIASLNDGTNVEINTGSTGAQAGNITVTSAITKSVGATSPTLTLNAAGAIAINAAIGFTSGGLGLILQSGGAITQTAAITASSLTANAGANAITLTNAANDFTGAVSLTNTGANNVAIRDANAILLGASSIGGTFSVTSAGAITQSGALTVAGATTLAAGATNSITLNDAGNDFSTLGVTTGLNVGVTDANALILSASTVSGTLDVNTSGGITQSGALTVTGVTTLGAGSGNNITLNSANNFSTLGITSGNNVAFTDSSGIILGASSVSGTLGVTANGAITQSGALSVSGVTTLAAGAANNITLNNVSNDFSTVGVTTGANVGLTDANSLILGASTVSGTYGVTTSGAITQSGALTITGVATLAAGAANDITLNSANNFSTIGFTNGNNVAFTDSNAVILGASTISGSLGVTATGAVTQSGALAVTGAATIAAGAANSITLNNASNNFNSVGITSALNVALTDSNALILGASTISGTLGVTTSGAITQSGALAVTGVTTLAAGAANNITLNDSANNFSTVGITTGLNVGLSDANALILAASTVSGTLDVNTSGAITQSGALAVTGAATLGAGAANNITLTAANNFSTIGITSANNVLLTDANALNFAASTLSGTLGVSASGAITQSGALSVAGLTTLAVGVGNNITLNDASNDFSTVSITTGLNVGLTDANSLILGTSNVSGTYGVTTSGAITQSGAITVVGVTTLAAGAANDITLTTATNNFSTVSTTSGNNVALRDSGGLIIGATTVANSLTVTAGSTITQSGVIDVPNLTVKTLLDFGAGITLNTSLNKVDNIDLRARNTADTANAAGAISYQDENGFNIANSLATISTISLIAGGDVTQNTGAGTGIFGTTLTVLTKNNSGAAITLTNSLNNVTTIDFRARDAANSANAAGALAYTDLNAVGVAAANTTSTVDLIAGNAITQSGTMTGTTLTAKTLLDAGAAITLNIAAGNEFNTINLLARNTADTANAAGAISYRDATGFDISGIATTSTLSLQNNNTPTNSPITQSGAIVAGVTTLIGGATNDITLNNAGNDFGTVATTSGLNVVLTDANALILGASTVSGTLDVNTTGAITQSGVVTVTGLTTLAAGAANNITLNSANNFSTIGITSGNNVGITDANTLILAASTVGGTLGVTTNGAITQSGALSVTGVTTLAAGAANNITLNNASNDFSTVGVTTALNVGLTDANSLILGASTVSGTYGITTSGAITQSGVLAITGVATLAAGSANNITLNSANNFSTIGFTSANNVAFTDSSGVILGASTISGTLGVTANGAITQSGALSVTGLTTLAAGAANSITLNNAGNDFSTVGITSGLNVGLTDANALILAASTVSGTLGVTTSGAITQSGALTVTGVATLAAGAANNITLNTLTNNFSTVGVTSGLNVTLTDANALILGASTVSGTFDVNTTGAITQSGVLTVTGVTTLAAGAANNITLNSANNFSTIGITSGNNVGITDANALILAASTVSGTLGVTTTGAITQSGTLSVTGVTTLAAGAANNITLNDTGNNFSTVGITSGLNVGLTDANSLILGTSTVSGTYGVTTSGAITQSGALTVTGVTTLAAGSANNITLTTATNNFSTVSTTSGNNVALRDSGAIIIGATTAASSLTVTAGGAITQSGVIDTPTLTAKTLGTNLAITLNSSLNKVNTIDLRARNATDTANSGGAIAYQDEDGFNIGNSIATASTISLIAGGDVTQNTGAGTGIFGTTLTVLTKNNSGAAITLTNALNDVATINLSARDAANSANAAGAISYRDLNAVAVAAANTTSTVDLIAGGAITQTGTMTGTTLSAKTLFNTGAAITLNIAAGNEFNTINLLARNAADNANAAGAISYRDATGFDVAGIATTSTLSLQNNNMPTNSPITQSGAIVAGVTTLIGGATNDITLNNAGNDFGTVATTSGLNVALTDANALILGTSTVSGTYNVNTTGAITQSGVVTVTGVTTLAAGAANNITLNSANNFSTIGITSGNNVGITDANALILAASTVSGTFGVTTAGALTQSGALAVTGVTTLAAGATNSITLNNASNDFSTIGITTGLNVALTDANALILGTSTVRGTYGVTTNGAITQSGALKVTGVTTLAAGAANNITLTTATNNFSTVSTTSGNNVALRDSGAIIIGATTAASSLAVTAGGTITQSGVIETPTLTAKTLINAGAAITLNTFLNKVDNIDLRARNLADTANAAGAIAYQDEDGFNIGNSIATASTVSLIAGGNITQNTGAGTGIFGTTLTVLTKNNSGAAVTLTNSLNDVATIDFRARDAANIANAAGALAYTDLNAIAVAAANTTSTVDLIAGGAITQTGTMRGTTLSAKTLLNTGAAITLNIAAGNEFNAINLLARNTTDTANAAGAISYRDATGFDVAGIATTSTLSLQNNNTPTNSPITQSGAIVAGVTTLIGGATNDITLNNAANDFSTVAITSGLNVALTDANALILGASTVSGTLDVNTSGAITQSAALSVTGLTTLAAGAANSITLSNAGNNFSAVGITSGNNVGITDANALILAASTVSGTLGVTTTGALTQSGALSVTGVTTLLAGAANNITLNNAGNNFSTVGITSGLNVVLTDANSLILGASTVSGTYGVTTSGAITQSGVLTITGVATLAAGSANNITLNSANNFSTIGFTSGNNVAFTDSSGVILGASTVSGTLGVTANGAITQSGALSVAGITTLAAGAANSITLNNAGNDFSTVGITSGLNVGLTDANALILGASTVSGTLGVTTNGAITQSGALTVTGVTTLAAGAANDITLNSANNFSTIGVTSGNNVALTDINAVILGASTVSGTLGVTTNGAITQSGVLSITGAATLAAGAANNITLNSANNFSTIGFTSGNNVAVTDTNAVILGASTVSGTLGVTAGGSISQSGALLVTGIPTFTVSAAASDINLASNANNFTATPVFTTTGPGTIRDLGLRNIAATAALPSLPAGLRNLTISFDNAAVNLPAITLTASGNLSVTANGAITQVGVLTVPGTASFNAGAGAITLLSNNQFTGAVSLANTGANDVAINAVSNLSLAAATIGRKLTATTTGTLSLTGALSANATGDSIILSAARFDNASGYALDPGANGRFLVWSSNANPFGGATPDNRGGLAYDFKQYNAVYGVSPVLGAGNGFLYTLAPSVTPVLTGTISKVYNSNVVANLTGHYGSTGTVDGDTVNFNPSTGVYASANVGTGINVSVAGITISGASNGAATVYGYSLASATANAFIGEITPATLTSTGITANNKIYDGNTQATLNFISSGLSGVYGGDTVTINDSTYSANFISANVANNVPVIVSGLGLGGASASNYVLTQPSGITANILSDGSNNNPQAGLGNQYNLIFPMNLIEPVVEAPAEKASIEIIVLNEPGENAFSSEPIDCSVGNNAQLECHLKAEATG